MPNKRDVRFMNRTFPHSTSSSEAWNCHGSAVKVFFTCINSCVVLTAFVLFPLVFLLVHNCAEWLLPSFALVQRTWQAWSRLSQEHQTPTSQRHDNKSLLGINSRALTLNDCMSDLVKGSAVPCKYLGFGFRLQLNQSWQTAAGALEWICHHH